MDKYSVTEYVRLARKSPDKEQRAADAGTIIANKYNFFKIEKKIESKFGLRLGVGPFSIFPVSQIISRWLSYADTINERLSRFNKRVLLDDSELASLLLALSVIKDSDPFEKRDLLMALGPVCEDTFVGPYLIVVDLLHRCNTNCLHCWLHSEKSPHSRKSGYLSGKMELAMFAAIAGEAGRMGTQKISLLANGEPLMHPDIRKIVEICGNNGLEFETITNGVFLDEQLSKFMLDSGATCITISLPAATPRTYKAICPASPAGDFEKVRQNTKSLVAYRKKVFSRAEIHMTHVIHSLNFGELHKFVEMDIKMGVDTVLFKIISLDEYNQFLKLKEEQVAYLRDNLPAAIAKLRKHGIRTDDLSGIYLNSYDSEQGGRTKDFFAQEGCLTGWSFCNIQLDGEVLFCCGNKMVDHLSGSSFEKIWFSEKYNRYRVAAKHIGRNKDLEFGRGEKLYDIKCDSCENVGEHIYMMNSINRKSLGCFL